MLLAGLVVLVACTGHDTQVVDTESNSPTREEHVESLTNDQDAWVPPCTYGDEIENTSAVAFYHPRLSYQPGDAVEFKIHSLAASVAITVANLGRVGAPLVYENPIAAARRQNYHCFDYSWGFTWQTTDGFFLDATAESGLYAVTVTGPGDSVAWSAFVVRPIQPRQPIAFIVGTNTWAAYNSWGGASFYRNVVYEEGVQANILAFDRPYSSLDPYARQGHLLAADRDAIRWMNENGYPADFYADSDFDRDPRILDAYKVVVIGGHSEYWTLTMVREIRNYVAKGGNLIVLGANAMYWRVALYANRIETRKEGGKFAYAEGRGGKWRNLGYPEAQLAGVAYTSSGFDTYAPYVVEAADHWVYADTGLADGDEFGHATDRTVGASGHETDKRSGATPDRTILLAKGANPDDGGAEMVLVPPEDGSGSVFSAGSITFSQSLKADPYLPVILKNVFDRFLEQ
ncbi:MAG: hypothetical protein D6800_01505 [Candidatus Zixiibacteriota bacterium]|nr:MAG: hypothetical protein D6800_01505 [candidate division Zixibacteria bacterium]